MISILSAINLVSAVDLNASLQYAYNFNSSANPSIDWKSGNNANHNGTPTYNSNGFDGGYFSYDGATDFMHQNSGTGINGIVSFEMVIRANSVQNDPYPTAIGSTANKYLNLYIDEGANNNYHTATGNGASWDSACNSATNIMNGNWYHIITTLDSTGNDIKHYINGTSDGSCTGITNWNGYSEQLMFMVGRDASNDYYVTGDLALVRIYDKELNTTEINWLWNSGDIRNTSTVLNGIIINNLVLNTGTITPTSPNKNNNITITSTVNGSTTPGIHNLTVKWYKNNILEKQETYNNQNDNTTKTHWFNCPTETCAAGDLINITINAYNSNGENKTSHNSVNINFLTETVTFYVRNNQTNALISNPNITVTSTGQSFANTNPLTDYNLGDFLNSTQIWELNNFTVIDLDYYTNAANITLNISKTQLEYNLSLEPVQLRLTFSGGAEGVITDTQKAKNFSNTSIIVYQTNLSIGDVKIQFRKDSLWNLGNHTQYYEYINNRATHINENITLLQNDLLIDVVGAYFRALDASNSVLEDVDVNAYVVYPGNEFSEYEKMGRRLTDSDGYTYFILDKASNVLVTFSKDGYTLEQLLLTPNDIDDATTKTEAYTVNMQESSTGTQSGITIGLKRDIRNRSLDIYGTIYAPGINNIKINTDYGYTQNRSNTTLTEGTLDQFTFRLQSGIDFSLTGTDNIILYVYADGTTITKTITFYTQQNNAVLSDWSFGGKALNIVLFLALIFMSSAIGWMWKTTSGGFTAFMIGAIGLSFISTAFIYMTLISVIYFIGKIAFKVTGE